MNEALSLIVPPFRKSQNFYSLPEYVPRSHLKNRLDKDARACFDHVSLPNSNFLTNSPADNSVPYSRDQNTLVHYTLELWDTNCVNGRYERLRQVAYPGTNVFLVCFSTSSRESFTNVTKQWRLELLRCCGSVNIILVGLKTDLRDQINKERIRSIKNGSLEFSEMDLGEAEEDPESAGTHGRPWQRETLHRHNRHTDDGRPNYISTAEGKALARRLHAKYVEGNVIDAFSDLNCLPHEIIHTALTSPTEPEKCIHIFPRGVGYKLAYVHTDKICQKAWSIKIPGLRRFHI